MHKFLFAAAVLSVSALGAIVENTSALKLQTTFYYHVEGSQVHIQVCDSSPSSDLDVTQCRPVTAKYTDFSPMDLGEFEAKATKWAQSDLARIAASATEAREKLKESRKQLAEIDAILKGLPADSPAVRDYQDRKRDLSARIAKLDSVIATGDAQSEGYRLLFGPHGYLSQKLIHPVVEGEETYLAVRPFVRHFLEVFKYRYSDPIQPVADAKAELAKHQAEGRRPYCAYWNGGFGASSELDSRREGIIRTLVSLDKTESFAAAKESCKALGMELPAAAHIPGYHSHLYDGLDQESWPVEKSTKMFAETELAKSLPDFDYLGQKLKIFWVQLSWTSRYHHPGDIDAFFTSSSGDWFRFNDGEDEGGVGVKARSLPVDPNWNLSVLCEKQYPTLPRYLESAELPECVRYIGWP